MNKFLDFIQHFRFLLLTAILLLVPVLVDLQITLGAGPETKFRLLEYGVLLAAICTLPLWCARRTRLRLNWIAGSIFAWIVYLLIRAAVDTHREYALDVALRQISWMLFILLAADACADRRDLIRMLWIACIGQLGPVILAVGNIFGQFIFLQWIKDQPWVWQNTLIGADRAVIWSSLGNPNYYANYGGILLIWLCTLLALGRYWWSRTLWAIYILIVLITLIYTFTRGIWVSLIPTLGLMLCLLSYRQIKNQYPLSVFLRIYGKRAIVSCATLVILLFAIFAIEPSSGPLHNTARRFQHGFQLLDSSLRSRPLLWYGALRMWHEKPIWGQGIGRYSPRFLETIYQSAQESDPQRIQQVTREMNTISTDQAHNDYVQILAETGLVGYALFLLFLVSVLFYALRGFFVSTPSRTHTILWTGCLSIVIMVVIQCLYDFTLLLPASVVLFALAVAGILVLTREEEPSTLSRREFPLVLRWIVSIGLFPILVVALWFVLKHLIATHNLDKGARFLTNGLRNIQQADESNAFSNFLQAENYIQRAHRLYPHHGIILFELGRLYASKAQLQRDSQFRVRAIDHVVRANETYCVPESYILLCNLYLDDLRYAQAQKMSDVLLIVDPEREDTQFLAAQVDYKARKYAEAAQHLRQELRLHPFNTKALALLGSIEQELFNNPGEAAVLYKNLLDIEPLSLDTHLRLGDVLKQLGDFDQARHHYETALEGTRALHLREMQKNVETKLNDLIGRMTQQEGRTNESRN